MMSKRTHILYHDDMDGWMSANLLLTVLQGQACLHECSYQKEQFNFKCIKKGQKVYLVDYSFSPDKMKLLKQNTEFYWIDHHKSAIELSKKYGYDDIEGIRVIGRSGAQLTQKYLFGSYFNKFIEYVGQFDTFRNSEQRQFFHGQILPFFYGFQMNKDYFNPKNRKIKSVYELDEELVLKLQKQGKIIYNYNKKQYGEYCKSKSFVRQIWGFRVLCINSIDRGTMIFQIPDFFDKQQHDMMCIYNHDGKYWNYGFYAPKYKKEVDCCKIAMEYGGGGHKSASGAKLEYLLEQLQ